MEEQDAQTENSSEKVAAIARSLISNLLKNADEDIGNKISLTVQNISEKVNLERFFQDMLRSDKDSVDEEVEFSYTVHHTALPSHIILSPIHT